LSCRAVALLNDEQGHPLMALTMRGDTGVCLATGQKTTLRSGGLAEGA